MAEGEGTAQARIGFHSTVTRWRKATALKAAGQPTIFMHMGLAQPKKRYTPQEYYALEREAPYKSDYYQGEIFAMAGGTTRHSLICSNLIRELGVALKKTPCAVYESNTRLKVDATGLRNYPDVSIYRCPLVYDEEDPDRNTVTNPTVLLEVLSKSTEAYDRGFKSQGYRQIESLQACVLVSQNEPHVEVFHRGPDGAWLFREVSSLKSVLSIPPLQVEVPLEEVYARVDFAADDVEGPLPA